MCNDKQESILLRANEAKSVSNQRAHKRTQITYTLEEPDHICLFGIFVIFSIWNADNVLYAFEVQIDSPNICTFGPIDRPTDRPITNLYIRLYLILYIPVSVLTLKRHLQCTVRSTYEKEQHMNNKKKESAWWLTISYAYCNSFHWPLFIQMALPVVYGVV